MKVTLKTFGEWLDQNDKWHTWFAWHPVFNNKNQIVWLEKVKRRYVVDQGYAYDYAYWEYK